MELQDAIHRAAGFVVAQPLHPGDNYRDASRAGPLSWDSRPQDVSRVIDALARHSQWQARLALDRVGVHGMSAGGVTALSLAGAQWRVLGRVRPDPRVAAVTVAVPVAAMFSTDSLACLRIPVGVVSADHDTMLSPAFHALRLLRDCPACSLQPAGRVARCGPHQAPRAVSRDVAVQLSAAAGTDGSIGAGTRLDAHGGLQVVERQCTWGQGLCMDAHDIKGALGASCLITGHPATADCTKLRPIHRGRCKAVHSDPRRNDQQHDSLAPSRHSTFGKRQPERRPVARPMITDWGSA